MGVDEGAAVWVCRGRSRSLWLYGRLQVCDVVGEGAGVGNSFGGQV